MDIKEINSKLAVCRRWLEYYNAIISEQVSFSIKGVTDTGADNSIIVYKDERFYNEIKGCAIREKAKVVAQIKYLSDKLKEYEKLVNGK